MKIKDVADSIEEIRKLYGDELEVYIDNGKLVLEAFSLNYFNLKSIAAGSRFDGLAGICLDIKKDSK